MTNSARIERFRSQIEMINDALIYFSKRLNESDFVMVEHNAKQALLDPNLFEAFFLWEKEDLSDDGLLYQLREYEDPNLIPPLSEEKRNLTGKEDEISRIKALVENDFALRLSKILQLLAASRGLKTNEKLAAFLGMNEEQVRTLCKGEHKPQRKTLMKIADKFEIPLDSFL